MPKSKPTPIEIAYREKAERERQQCERAILNRLYTAPARIEDLDRTGFPKKLINAVVNDLLHEGRIICDGFTYFYNHLRFVMETQLKRKIS